MHVFGISCLYTLFRLFNFLASDFEGSGQLSV